MFCAPSSPPSSWTQTFVGWCHGIPLVVSEKIAKGIFCPPLQEKPSCHCDEFTFLLGCIHRVWISLTDSVTTACQKMHHCIFLIISSVVCAWLQYEGCFPFLFTGPGPGRYVLPPAIGFVGHDFTKSTSPAYSFHSRMSNNSTFRLTCSKCSNLIAYFF